jgi:hypothetical protein
MCYLPFTTANVLVDDAGNGRVVEVDLEAGTLVKVWLTAARGNSMAASVTMVAIASGATVSLYDTSGNLLRTVNTGSPGMDVWGMRFSINSSYIMLTDNTAQGTLRKVRTSDGVVLSPFTNAVTLASLDDVEECVSPVTGGVGVLLLSDGNSNIALADGVSALSTWNSGGLSRALAMSYVAGLGIFVADYNNNRLVRLSSVAIATHPVNATVLVGSTTTFTVALTANSATTGVTYAWTKGGVSVGTNSPSYTYTGVGADGAGPQVVACTVSHAAGLAVSNNATLTVQVLVCSRLVVCAVSLGR